MEHSIAPVTKSRGCDEKMKIVHNGMQSVLDELFMVQVEGFDVSLSSD